MALYADITEIVAPSSAGAGSRVDITVKVKNLYSASIGIKVVGVPEYPGLPGGVYIDGLYPNQAVANVGAGATYSFSGYFIMPNSQVTIHIYSYYYSADTNWYLDDEMTKVVNLAPTLAGKIVDKWVNKIPEGNYLPIPASVKADGNTFEVGISYRNDSPVNITGGVEVVVTKPDGYTKVTPAIDWSGIGIGQTLTKQYNIAAVNQVGNWTIVIRFLTQSMQVLDTFSGICIISGAELVPVISEFEILDYIKV